MKNLLILNCIFIFSYKLKFYLYKLSKSFILIKLIIMMQTKLLLILVSLLAVALLGASFFSQELRGLTGVRKLRIPEESVSDFSEEQLETKEIYKYDETYATKEMGYAEISY